MDGGSSPHTRGALVVLVVERLRVGIIPAYAGSTQWTASCTRWFRDHPRIRGEHTVPAHWGRIGRGSSPHTRGAPQNAQHGGEFERIIPAYAGSTWPSGSPGTWLRDHPRIRGEHAAGWFLAGRSAGSSPHTRGARSRRLAVGGPRRIIPAYAGSTPRTDTTKVPNTDHPRIRGEHVR